MVNKKLLQDKIVGFGKYREKELKWVAKNDLDFFVQIKKLYYQKFSDKKKSIYDKLYDLYINTGDKTGDDKFQDRVFEIVSWLKEKKTNEEIWALYKLHYPGEDTYNNEAYQHAKALIRKEFSLEKENLVSIHLMRYEEIWDSNFNVNLEHIQPGYRNAIKCEKYITAMETLFQKEKLLGLHLRKFRDRVGKQPMNKDVSKLDFDVNKLSFEEQLELMGLLEKAKPKEHIIREVVVDDNPLNVVSKTELKSDILESPLAKGKQTDIVGEEEAKKKGEVGKTYIEVQENIHNSLMSKVKEIYDKKFKK